MSITGSFEVFYQMRIKAWLVDCFGNKIACNITERNHRFLEEALELIQAGGCTKDEAHKLVEYVFGRPVGELPQEVGGVMTTLTALCTAHNIDVIREALNELQRIEHPDIMNKIRAKQAAKPKFGPLSLLHDGS